MTSPSLLIVDDEHALLEALPETLRVRMPGVVVETSDNALSALERIEVVDYDAIVTDIKMPGCDGLTLLARIRAVRPRTPTLLITGHGQHDLAVQALRGGAFDFIQKPIDRDYFVASLDRAVRLRQLDREVERQQAELQMQAEELARIVEDRTRDLSEANRVKDEFLATLSHELRTPLTAILGWARLLRSGTLDAERSAGALEAIERNAKSQARLIEDLLDVSRIITGKIRLDMGSVDIAKVIDGAIASMAPSAEARNVSLERHVANDLPPLWGDAERLQQVVWNLLSNSVKFTPEGGRVEIVVSVTEHRCAIAVSDTGIGVAPELVPHVFERFRQGDSSPHRSQGGLGLGLAIVRHIVELHGGRVRVESAGEGAGATFTVELPRRRVPATVTDRPSAKPAERRRISEREIPATRLAGVRVLLVDDDRDARECFSVMLAQLGVEVTAMSSAVEALDALDHHRFDVLLCDIGMPELDGVEFIRRVRERPDARGGRIPAAALTAYARAEDRAQALEAGFQMHIAKPIEPSLLASIVAQLARRATASENRSEST